MKRLVIIALLISAACNSTCAQKLKNFSLHIDKTNLEAANLHIGCSFSVDFQDADSVVMNFGGGQEFSIENLAISGDVFEHAYYREAKRS